jgi:FkbM family methyltransferase
MISAVRSSLGSRGEVLGTARDAARRTVKSALLRRGIEMGRIRPHNPASRRARIMSHHQIGVVLDIGANRGTYAVRLREAGYRGRIDSFEPVGSAFAELKAAGAGDPQWHVHQLALGTEATELDINVAAGTSCSSFFELSAAADGLVEGMHMVARERVPVRRMDEIGLELDAPTMAKLDVQGFELQVLEGATAILERITVVEIELSLAQLYTGQPHALDLANWLRDHGFDLVGVDPGEVDPRSGYTYEIDGIFARR